MQSATINKGIVKFADGKLYDSKYDTRKRMKIVVMCNNQEIPIWGYEDSLITNYQTNDPIEFAQNGNEYIFFNPPTKRHAADTQPTPSASTQTVTAQTVKKWEEPSKDMKQDILNYSQFQSKIYLHIFKKVSDDFTDMGLKDEQIKDISTTIFITTQKKFNI